MSMEPAAAGPSWADHHSTGIVPCPACGEDACPVADDGELCCAACLERVKVYEDAGSCPHGWVLAAVSRCARCTPMTAAGASLRATRDSATTGAGEGAR